MRSRFTWQTDEQRDWIEEEEPPPDLPKRRPLLLRRPRLLLAIVIQVGFVIAILTWVLVRRQQVVEQQMTADVMASYDLLQRAVASEDVELYTSFLSKEDPDWVKAQRQLVTAGLITSRDPLGLVVQTASSTPSIHFTPDWREAELTFEQQYLNMGLQNNTQPVRLRQTSLYRYYRTQRWLQVPPDEQFWGKTVVEDSNVLTLEYPERDAALSQRLGHDLQEALLGMCGQPSSSNAACSSLHVNLRLTTDPAVLVSLAEQPLPVFQGRTFVMPAPTLVGIPVDEESYQAVYDGYSQRILETVDNNLQGPISIPDEVVQALCRNGRQGGLEAYQFDPWFDTWTPIAADGLYSNLQPLPQDSGVILRRGLPGTELYDLQVTLLRNEQEYPLVDIAGSAEELVNLIGFASGPKARLLIRRSDSRIENVNYQAVDVDACAAGQCVLERFPGFPIWSPNGRQVLLADRDKIYRQDWQERPLEIDNGFNAFWLTDETYGYVKSVGRTTQIMLASINDDRPHVVVTTDELAAALNTPLVSIAYVIPSPVDANTLYMAVTNTGIDQDFYLVSLHLPAEGMAAAEDVTVHLQLEELPRGDATLLTPTGYPPFVFSPDGRFLLLVERIDTDAMTSTTTVADVGSVYTDAWRLLLYNIDERESQTINLKHPAYPARFPFYDWSADGQWLITIDSGMLRLVAPEFGYERLLPHDFESCYYAGWTTIGE